MSLSAGQYGWNPQFEITAIDYFHYTDGLISKTDYNYYCEYQPRQWSDNQGFMWLHITKSAQKTGQILGISVKIPHGKTGQISKSAFGLIIKVAND